MYIYILLPFLAFPFTKKNYFLYQNVDIFKEEKKQFSVSFLLTTSSFVSFDNIHD